MGGFVFAGDLLPWFACYSDRVLNLLRDNVTMNAKCSLEQPMVAKTFKDNINEITKKLANGENIYIDVDGFSRVYVKFSNGRIAQIESYNEDMDTGVFFIHDCTFSELKKHWSSVSSAILFSIAFRFTVLNDKKDSIDLILRRSPDNAHISDSFCDDILATIQSQMESEVHYGLMGFIEDRFDGLEKLVKKIHDNQKTGGTLVRRTNR